MEGVSHLVDQPLISPSGAMLERHQAYVGDHGDAGSADVELGSTPVLLELLEDLGSIQHLIQASQLVGQGVQ
jgi:hypothetical protein